MKIKIMLYLAFAVLMPAVVNAQTVTEGVQSFRQGEDAWKRQEKTVPEEIRAQSRFVEDAGKIAIDNILKAEQVFCYEVLSRNDDYEGYSLDGFPIRGFCGILGNQVRDTVSQFFLSSNAYTDFNSSEQCVIQPKIMLRFVRGVDFTDMLLSSPCHAFALYYGGNVLLYNFKPGAEILDALVNSLSEKHSEFISPALLNQLLPVGLIQNDQQRKMVNKRSEPIRKWLDKAEKDEAAKAAEREKNQRGWNKLKMRNLAN